MCLDYLIFENVLTQWPCSLKPHDSCDREFETIWGHSCLFPVFVVCFVGSVICDELIICSEETYWDLCVCVCVYNSMWSRNMNNEAAYNGGGLLSNRRKKKCWRIKLLWCICVRASYMKLTRDTHLMQQFIYTNLHQCTRLHTGSSEPQPQHVVLNTICSSIISIQPNTPEGGHIDARNM